MPHRAMKYTYTQLAKMIDHSLLHPTMTDADIAAAAVVRIAVCHYLVRGDDRAGFLAELRYAAGIEVKRKRGLSASVG